MALLSYVLSVILTKERSLQFQLRQDNAGYCSVAGIEYVWQQGADVLVRVNPQSFVAYSTCGRRISLLQRLRTLSQVGQFGEWRVVLHGQGSVFTGRLCAVRKSDCAIQQFNRLIGACDEKLVRSK